MEQRMLPEVNTVNVIEMVDDDLRSLYAYLDTPEGNKAAEELFQKICKENGVTNAEDSDFLENTDFTEQVGNYQVLLFHSLN
jgi:hypothetical protein